MKKFSTKMLTRAGAISALYVALTFFVLPIASNAIQFRISEALTVFPLLFAESIPALFIGCIIANLISGCAIYDIVFGSLITLVAGVLTYFTGNIIKKDINKLLIGGLFPILMNAFLLPLIWYVCYGNLEYLYILQVVFLIISQTVAIFGIGIPLYFGTKKLKSKFPILFE